MCLPRWRNGRRGGLKILWGDPCGFESRPGHLTQVAVSLAPLYATCRLTPAQRRIATCRILWGCNHPSRCLLEGQAPDFWAETTEAISRNRRKRRYILTASALPLLKPRLPAARSGAGAPLLSCPAFRVPVLPMWTGAGLPRQEVSEGERVSRSESPLSPPATAGAQRLAAFRAPVAVRSPPATPATSRLRLPQVV